MSSVDIRSRFSAWLDSSVGNRIAMAGITAASAMVVLFGILAFTVLSYQSWSNFQKSAEGDLTRITEHYEFRLQSVRQDFVSLTKNSFVINSLADSTGREIYLLPTLRDFRLSTGITGKVILFDANMTPFAGNTTEHASMGSLFRGLAASAFKDNAPRATMQWVDGAHVLAMAFPVYYPPSSSFEGVLLGLVAVETLFRLPQNFLDSNDCLTLTSHGAVLSRMQCDEVRSGIHLQRGLLQGDKFGEGMGLTLDYIESWSGLLQQLGVSLFIYLVIGGVTVLAAYVFSRRTGEQFAQQLKALGQASQAIAENPSARARVEWGRPDEIGRFAEDFNTMVARLQEFQLSLEERIRERTQELILARDQAQAASLAKSNFLASMSHELRTPMNAVLGFSQLIELDATGNQADMVREVLAAGQHMLTLIDDVLDLARIESDRLTVNIEPVALAGVLKECVSVVLPQVQSQRLEMEIHDALPAGSLVMADRVRLKQVLINLLSNAIKYNRPGGRIQISCRLMPTGRVRLQISDTGQGIPLERQDQLFEAFNRLGRENSKVKGTGIGLVISKKLIQMMGGDIDFRSEPGQGSEFWIDLPLSASAAETARGAGA